MKKITLFVCSILLVTCMNAQNTDQNNTDNSKLTFAKGSQFINVNLSLRNSKSDVDTQSSGGEVKTFNYSINPSYAYAISDNLFLGLGLGYSYSKRKDGVNMVDYDEVVTNSYEVFPFVRYYKGIGKKLALFIQGEARYSYFESELNILNGNKSNNFFFGIRPGLTLMLNKNLALETSIGALGYRTGKSENERNDNKSSFDTFEFSLNSSNLFFGLSYYL